MNHQPTQLALLISLIGVGVTPLAQASVNPSAGPHLDDLAIDATLRLPGMPCVEPGANALASCAGDASELVWQAPLDALELDGAARVRLLYSAPRDDWAPGETPPPAARDGRWVPRAKAVAVRSEVTLAAAKLAEAREAARQIAVKKAAESRKSRVLTTAAARMHGPTLAKADAAVARNVLLAVPVAAEVRSAESERLFENLIAVLADAQSAPAPSTPAPAQTVDLLLSFGDDGAAASDPASRLRKVEPAQLERATKIVVASESSKVLRSLGAIRSEVRNEVGAISAASTEGVVTTQTGKVMAMLDEVAPRQKIEVEDGPTKRLRKLAALAAKEDAKAAAEAAARLAEDIALNGVDLMLPLEAPVFEKSALALGDDARAAKIELRAAVASAAPAAKEEPLPKRTNPFGEDKLAVAESSLANVRGGFSGGDGLNISFGIERAVYINGSLVTTTTMNVNDLGQAAAGRAAAGLDPNMVTLVQNGVGNTVSNGTFTSSSIGTVIQNTLDGQKIQNVTVINATANSLGVFRNLNLGSSLRSAVIDSLRR